MSGKVIITRRFLGICHMQVCASLDATDAEILDKCNSDNPCGTAGGWSLVCRADTEFWKGIAPVPCEDDPTRIHYVVAC